MGDGLRFKAVTCYAPATQALGGRAGAAPAGKVGCYTPVTQTLPIRLRGAPVKNISAGCSNDVNCEIEALVVGDGVTNKCGLVLEKGLLYAAASWTAGPEGFQKVDHCNVDRASDKAYRFETRWFCNAGKGYPRACVLLDIPKKDIQNGRTWKKG